MSFNWGAAMAGAGEGLQTFLSNVQREQLMEASLKAHEAINIAAEGRAESRRIREKEYDIGMKKAEAADIESNAQALADARGGLLSKSAFDAYATADMSKLGGEEGRKAGMQAVSDAERAGAYQQTPTNHDRLQARVSMGLTAPEKVIELERTAEKDEYAKTRDARTDANSDRDFKLREARNRLDMAAEGRLKKGADLDIAIKEIQVDNAKLVESLRKEYTTAAPERKAAIKEEMQILTGKDNDSFLPVPVKDQFGNPTGEYRVFDKKSGTFVEPAAKARDVKVGGVVIGQAKTAEEAQKMVEAHRNKPAAPSTSPGAPAANPPPPSPAEATQSGPGLLSGARSIYQSGVVQDDIAAVNKNALEHKRPEIEALIAKGMRLSQAQKGVADALGIVGYRRD